jgi:capsular exopolysaccharide synthesis family protein
MWLGGKLDLSDGHLYTEELVNYLGTQADLLRSRVVMDRALSHVKRQLPEGTSLRPPPGMLDVVRGHLRPSARAKLAEAGFPFRLKATESPKSSIIELEVQGAEPKSTSLFLDALMQEYLNFKRENREATSERAVDSLARGGNDLAAQLRAQQEKVYAFQMSNNVVFLQQEQQGSGAGSYLLLLNRQLAMLQTELNLLQTLQPDQWVEMGAPKEQGAFAERPPGEAPAEQRLAGLVGPRDDLFRATQQIHLLEAKRDELAKALRPMHPKILKLDEDIASQKQLKEIARTEIQKQLVSHREALTLELTNLQKAFNEWDQKTLAASRKMVDYDRLRQDVQRTQAAYDRLLSVSSTVAVGKSVDQENVSVLEPASAAVPVNKVKRNLAAGIVLALLLGAGLVWVLGKMDDRFTSQAELAEDIPERVLGQVLNVRLSKPERQMRPEALMHQRFEFLEAFRSVRSALWFMGENGDRPKTILVTSSSPQEGKSTVALYLAVTLAKAGSRVLLVDADMRRAKLHRYFSVASGPGLAEILNKEPLANEPVVPTTVSNLDFLPAGAPSMEPGELVLPPQFGTFLERVSAKYDHVILDSPPVLAADDAAALAPRVDGVVFVVRAACTSARIVREALDALRQRRARVLGLIFNRAVSSAFQYHPYRRYKAQYSWQPA